MSDARPRLRLPSTLALALALTGSACAPTAASPPSSPSAGPLRLELPRWTNAGPGREVEILAQDGGLKIAAIALRRGTPLPEHRVDARISVQVLRGAGELEVAGEAFPVDAGSLLVIDAQTPHAMQPADEELVVLLVHYLGS